MKQAEILILSFLFIFSSLLFPQIEITNSVASGGVTPNSAKFRVRVSQAAEINVEVSEDPAFTTGIKGIPISTSSESDFAGIVNVSGLNPDTKYYYRILINNLPADPFIRYLKTFPAEGMNSDFSFVFGSCQQSGPGSMGNVYKEIVKHEPRFFLQIGDWGYPDTTDNVPFDNNFFAASYPMVQLVYERKYNPAYPMDSLMKITPVEYVYDDHDFMNNNASALTSSFSVPIKPNPLGDDFIVQEITNPENARENSIRGYKENFPGYPLVNESRGIYHKFIYGNAEFFVLDLRAQRSPNLDALKKNNLSGLWEFNPPEGHTILGRSSSPGSGESQIDWFLNNLSNSTAVWKFIISSVPFNKSQKEAIDLSILLQDLVLDVPSDQYPDSIRGIFAAMELADKWAGFKSDIDTVLNFISANNINNVIVLSGDSHTAAIDDGANSGLPEIMAGGLDITNSQLAAILAAFGLNIWNRGGQGLTTSEFNNAFGKVSVFGSDSVRLSLIDEFGTSFAGYTVLNQITDIENTGQSNIPAESGLSQNFPNPFNPTTNIEYRVGSPETVTLKIYDVLGNEVAVLVNQEKPAGEYIIKFDAESLSSGIYFYQLKAGSFIETKKMILLR